MSNGDGTAVPAVMSLVFCVVLQISDRVFKIHRKNRRVIGKTAAFSAVFSRGVGIDDGDMNFLLYSILFQKTLSLQ